MNGQPYPHPARCFPLEHKIAEYEHQCDILRGAPTVLGTLAPPQGSVDDTAVKAVIGVPVGAT
eukprot:1071297-Prymnesium_polylepis.1